MGIFDPHKPKVSEKELKEARTELRHDGLTARDVDDMSNILAGSLHEHGIDHGVDKKELERALDYMKEHPNAHHLSKSQLAKVEKELKKKL